MAFKKLKLWFDVDLAILLAKKITEVYPEFNSSSFCKEVESRIDSLELKDRVEVFADAFHNIINKEFTETVTILLNILGSENQDETGMFKKFYWIMPIAKFVEGKFNTSLKINGILGKDMMPDYNTLNSEGLLETLDAVVKNFKPVNEMAKKLNVKDLENLNIKNTKNTFFVKDGKVEIKPFDVKMKVKEDNINMNIGGNHSINQDMDYNIKLAIPRKLLEKSSITSAVNTGIDLLSGQASKLGLNLKQGENINLLVNMLGSLTNPKIKVKLLGMDGENVVSETGEQLKNLTEEAKKKALATADSLKRVAEEQAQAELDKVKAEAQAKSDSLKAVAKKKADEELAKIAEKAKKEAKDKIDEVIKDKVSDEVKDAADEAMDKVKDVADDVTDSVKDKVADVKGKSSK